MSDKAHPHILQSDIPYFQAYDPIRPEQKMSFCKQQAKIIPDIVLHNAVFFLPDHNSKNKTDKYNLHDMYKHRKNSVSIRHKSPDQLMGMHSTIFLLFHRFGTVPQKCLQISIQYAKHWLHRAI